MPRLLNPREVPYQKRGLSEKSWALLHDLDALLADPAARDAHSYKALRKKLAQIPRAEQGIDWVERLVAVYCVKGLKDRRCAALKIQMKQLRETWGEEDKWDAYFAKLSALIAPYVLTNHGLVLPFSARDQDEVARDLTEVFDLLDGLGYTSFINSGTLLGAVREGHFLGHDDDADLAVLLPAKNDAEVTTLLCELCDKLNDSGKMIKPAWMHKGGPVIQIEVGSGVSVDLFPLWIRDGKAYIWPHTYGELTEDDIFPLGTQTLCGTAFPAPKNAAPMLELNYGKGWQHPDPNFYFPWGEAKVKFASMLKAYVRLKKSAGKWQRIVAKLRGK